MSDLRIHHVSFSVESMTVTSADERSITVFLTYFPRLQAAQPHAREQWQLSGRGLGLYWEILDENVSVENIVSAYSRSQAGEYAHAAHL